MVDFRGGGASQCKGVYSSSFKLNFVSRKTLTLTNRSIDCRCDGKVSEKPGTQRIRKSLLMLKYLPNLESDNSQGFALANNTTLPFYEYLSEHPKRAQQFSQAMSGASTGGLQTLADNFPWSSLPANALVLDVGGSQGHVSSFLAAQFMDLKFVVQDLPAVLENLTFQIPEELKGRVELMAYDFFETQNTDKLKDVDAVLMRYIFHNWSDEYCVRILRNLKGVLKKGARIVVQDHLLPEPGSLGLLKENSIRSMDLTMLALFNSRERDEDDWRKLFHLADPRFKFESAKRAKVGDFTGIIVATWDV